MPAMQKLRYIIGLLLLVHAPFFMLAQTCNQPGMLLSVRNSYRSHIEYVVFTFVNPTNTKGDLHKTNNGPFIQTPLNNMIRVSGHHFFKLSFVNSYQVCDTKNYVVVPQKKIMDVKRLQQSDGVISYVIGLAEGAKITAHTAYNYHGFHFVKLRVE
jgi:hypothetical protein